MNISNTCVWIPAEMAVNAGISFSSAPNKKGGFFMTASKSTPKYPCDERMYFLTNPENMTFDDGTRVVTYPKTDIKRPICAGIDVHKSILVAAVCVTDMESLKAVFYVRQFTTSNSDVRRLAKWLLGYNVQDVCMESTGKYWIPVYDILEQNGLRPILTHPKYVKQAKGRKTDFRDAIHIASLFRMDLVVASFIPPADIRDLRELCRYRLKLTYIRTSEKNRYQNSMTVSKVRLDSVFTDPFGKSATNIMSYLINTDPENVSDDVILHLVHKGCKSSPEEILDSIHGYEFIGVQRDKLKIINMHLEDINKCIAMIDQKLQYYRRKYNGIIQHLTTMIGVSVESALYILGEIGADMSVWHDSASLSSWAGLSPANNASARKNKTTTIGKGGHYLKPLLVQCALAAIKSTKKHPYFYNKYISLKKRRGHKKAIIAIARKMLVSIYHMIRENKDFRPIDYDKVVTCKQSPKELNLKNIIEFLGERGVDANTIRIVEKQCSQDAVSQMAAVAPADKKEQEKKQPKTITETTATEQKPAKRRLPKSLPNKTKSLVQLAAATT